jgi:hypothetical protein
MEILRRWRYVFLSCLILSFTLLFVTLPFFHDGFFQIMDDVQVVRIKVMQEELSSGQFPVRYIDSFGNGGGYMLFNFYPPLVYYLGVTIALSGLTIVKTTKIVFLVGYLIGTIGMYTLLRRYFDHVISIIGTILFLTATYLAFDVYFRGALVEVYAYFFIPWVFYFWSQLKDKVRITTVTFAGLTYALLILSHGITAFAYSLLLGLYILFPPWSKEAFSRMALALIFGLGISAFFWIPLILEQNLTIYKQTFFVVHSYKGNFLNPLQTAGLQTTDWPFRPPLLGLGLFIGAIISTLFALRNKKIGLIYWYFCISFIISSLLTWDISKFLWDNIDYLRFMQFPYRFLTLTTFSAVMLIAFGLARLEKLRLKIILGILLILPAITLHYQYLRPTNYRYVSDEIYKAEDACSTTTWAQELLPKSVKECLPKDKTYPLVQANGDVLVKNVVEEENGRKIKFDTEGKGEVIVRKYYFPGWETTVDDKHVKASSYGNYGLIRFAVPEGTHNVVVSLQDTHVRSIGNIVSGISLLSVASFLLGSFLRGILSRNQLSHRKLAKNKS